MIIDKITNQLTSTNPLIIEKARLGPFTSQIHDKLAAEVLALSEIEHKPLSEKAHPVNRFRIAAWNAERLKYHDASVELVKSSGVDILLLSEADIGLARSGNRHTVEDLARELGFGYIYGVEFLETDLGDDREKSWHAGQTNNIGFHGNSILSRYELSNAFMIRLDDGAVWYGHSDRSDQVRLGYRMALAAEIKTAHQPLWVVCAHLESSTDSEDRHDQFQRLLEQLQPRIGNACLVIGGDLNTNALPHEDKALKRCMTELAIIEPLFQTAAHHNLNWTDANLPVASQRMRPDGTPKAPFTRLDWLMTRGVKASNPLTLPAVDRDGVAISDHEYIVIDVEVS
jgi:endonuclease/exonuclease/phosphatase family metal-dependent hydrolase